MYRHTQIGWMIIGAVTIGVVAAALPLLVLGFTGAVLCVLAIAVGVLASFSTLTVSVDDRQIEARFGVGVIRRRVALADVRSHRTVRNPWYYGWGLRFIPRGRLYNVSGLSAVELMLAGEHRLRIGTDEPEALAGVIESKVGPSAAPVVESESGWGGLVGEGLVLLVVAAPVLSVVALAFYVGLRPPVVAVLPDLLSVRSGLYGDEIPLPDILDVSLEPTLPVVRRRTNGFALGGTLRGRFELDGLGDVRLFLQRDVPPFVRVETAEKVIFIGFKDQERTRRLYAELVNRTSPE